MKVNDRTCERVAVCDLFQVVVCRPAELLRDQNPVLVINPDFIVIHLFSRHCSASLADIAARAHLCRFIDLAQRDINLA